MIDGFHKQANGLKVVTDEGVPLFGASPIKYCHYLIFMFLSFCDDAGENSFYSCLQWVFG